MKEAARIIEDGFTTNQLWENGKHKKTKHKPNKKTTWAVAMIGHIYINICLDLYMHIKDASDMLTMLFKELVAAYPADIAIGDYDAMTRATLLMLGAGGIGTGLHVDWENAINLAVLIADTYNSNPVALWLFIKPTMEAINNVHEYLMSHPTLRAKYPQGLAMWRSTDING